MKMSTNRQRKIVRILFDEFHSESWSISRERAQEMNSHNPAQSSYALAAGSLSERDFIVERNLNRALDKDLLSGTDVLVFLHPCDRKWEKTTSSHSPKLSPQEITDIQEFVKRGGGLLVVTEYESDKYGNNLNEMLSTFGLQFENTTLVDVDSCHHENPTWIFGQPSETPFARALGHLVEKSCFYRSASCTASGPASLAWRASESATPPNAGLIGVAMAGAGRVVAVADSSLFGDPHLQEFHHLQLWLNLIYWCSAPTFHQTAVRQTISKTTIHPAWLTLKAEVNALRLLQNPDGSILRASHEIAQAHVSRIRSSLKTLTPLFEHQHDYLAQVDSDLDLWARTGLAKPNFGASLAAYHPERHRRDQLENLVFFPMYTPNASRDTRFEALVVRVPWPDWLGKLEHESYRNDRFAPGHLVDFTEGYESECAVLFPEIISLHERPTNNFSTIFCNREAQRLQRYSLQSSTIVQLDLHPQLECFLGSLPLMEDTLALWDLIHDKSHSLGELPFDPFMIRQRAPYWMYALEELRVDLRSFGEALQLAQNGFPFAHYVTYAILLDRIFRFPVTGPRVRNYDALGGQLLFSFLHQKDVLIWSESKLRVRWEILAGAVAEFREEIAQLYKFGSECSKVSFWIAAHDLVATHVVPNVASKWKKQTRIQIDETDPKKWIEAVHDDEFPLGSFHTHLLSRLNSMPAGKCII